VEQRRIVLVDEDRSLRASLRGALTGAGWSVVGEASDGRRGVEVTLDERPNVVLMDLQVPQMGGVEATRAIRAMAPEVEIVILTEAEDRAVFEALKAGAGGFLLKGQPPGEVVAGVEQARVGESPITSKIAKLILGELTENSSEAASPRDAQFTPRELEILRMLVDGETSPSVATRLCIDLHTANAHVRDIYRKLEVTSRSQAVRKALRDKIL
jgi:NarL family two-component system response regulator LiaR